MSRNHPLPRLPLQPLLEATGVSKSESIRDRYVTGRPNPISELAHRCGVRARTVHRWRTNDLEMYVADRAAISCGLHPADVWGQAWWDACALASEHEPEEEEAAA
jgi:hypothetical protein